MVEPEAEVREARERVAARVRALRHARERSQEKLAHDAGLAPRHLQKIEAAEVNVTLETLVRLALALGVDVGALLGRNAPE